MYFDPENIVKLAIEGGCNGVASTLGVLGAVARKYAHKIPFLLKFNHNEFISYPNAFDQIRFASIKQAFDMGAQGVGATIYFGSEESKRQLQEVTTMFQQAHELGNGSGAFSHDTTCGALGRRRLSRPPSSEPRCETPRCRARHVLARPSGRPRTPTRCR